MTDVKRTINSILMYLYLLYYKARLSYDTRFMLKELHAALVDDLKRKKNG